MKVEAVGAESFKGSLVAPKSGQRFTDKERRDELSKTINERNILYPGMIRQNRMTHADSERRQGILLEMFAELDAKIRSGETQQAEQIAEESEAEQQAQIPQVSSAVEPITVTGAVEVGGIGGMPESITPPESALQDVRIESVDGKSEGERAG